MNNESPIITAYSILFRLKLSSKWKKHSQQDLKKEKLTPTI